MGARAVAVVLSASSAEKRINRAGDEITKLPKYNAGCGRGRGRSVEVVVVLVVFVHAETNDKAVLQLDRPPPPHPSTSGANNFEYCVERLYKNGTRTFSAVEESALAEGHPAWRPVQGVRSLLKTMFWIRTLCSWRFAFDDARLFFSTANCPPVSSEGRLASGREIPADWEKERAIPGRHCEAGGEGASVRRDPRAGGQ